MKTIYHVGGVQHTDYLDQSLRHVQCETVAGAVDQAVAGDVVIVADSMREFWSNPACWQYPGICLVGEAVESCQLSPV